jgi:hypothetical protein
VLVVLLHVNAADTAWVVIFFFASAGASAGYLTAREVFLRIGTGNDPNKLYVGYLIGAA